MSPRVEDFPACASCGGKLFPLVLCETCGAASILHDADRLEPSTACPECGSPNPWQLICDQCHSRFPAPEIPAESPPALVGTAEPAPPPAPPGRKKRHLRAELDTTALSDMLSVLGLDPSRAQALIDRGYSALWKIARVKEADLARIPEVGPIAARKIFASFDLLNYSPPQQTRESILQEEYDCPLCGCRTSAFAPTCLECGADFDEEEMDEELRSQFAREGDETLLAFYDGRLAQSPDDPDLLFGRGLLLEVMGRFGDAFESLARASSKAPDSKEIKVAVLRVQAKRIQRPGQARALRSTATALLDDAAWDQEVAQLDNLIARPERACPECGVGLPDGVARCPSCGALVAGPPEGEAVKPSRPRESPELDLLVDDLLVGELERSLSPNDLDKTKAAVLDWLIQELEDSLLSEEKLTPVATKDTKTPQPVAPESSPLAASVGFLSRWMEGSRGLLSGKPPRRGIRDTPGKVNGLVNGVGRVNGLVNGLGRVNGLATPAGRVNGLATPRGRVNGLVAPQGRTNGFVNGTRFVRSGSGRIVRFPQPSVRMRYAAIASATLVAVVIFAVLFIPIPGPTSPISIDGSFQDWNGVPMLDVATSAADTNISIAKYASLLDRDSLYLFASTVGGMLADSARYDGMYFLIDADGNVSTGYAFNGLGADAMVEVFGGNHTVVGARLYTFPPDSEVNWSRRQPGGQVQAAASRDGLELRVSTLDLPGFVPDRFQVSVYADDFRGGSSRSLATLSQDPRAVFMRARPLTSVVGNGSTPLFEIHLHALGIGPSDRWNVSNFGLTATFGVAVSLSAESVILTQGQPNATVTASVSAPGFLSGDLIQVNVLGALTPGTGTVFVEGSPVRAYVLAPRPGIRIDGLFADWIGRDVPDSDPAPVTDSNVDIVRSGAAVNQTTIFFHVAVAGDLFAGQVPQRIVPSSSRRGGNASGPPIPLQRETGEDILRVYVDINATDSRGLSIGGIYADYMLEIRGIAGRIRTRTLFSWSPGWTKMTLPPVALQKDATDVEGSILFGSTTNTTRVVLATTDWAGIGDVDPPAMSSGPVLLASVTNGHDGGKVPGLIILSGPNPQTATPTPLTSVPLIDGNCTTGEYDGATVASDSHVRFLVGSRSDTQFVYLCLEVTSDISNDTVNDSGELLFDQALDGGALPRVDDRRFRVTSGLLGAFTSEAGNSLTWIPCVASCDGGDAAKGRFDGTKEVYEFKIRYSDIWGNNSPSSNAVAGFAIVAHDQTGSVDYAWGASSGIVDTIPDTWGYIQIPEFRDFLWTAVSVVFLVVLLRRRRPHS